MKVTVNQVLEKLG